MSKENAKKFLEELKKNEKLQKAFETLLEDCSKIFSGKVAEFAKKAGFSCTAADLNDLTEGDGELSDEDLQKAAGGYWRLHPWYYRIKYGKKNNPEK